MNHLNMVPTGWSYQDLLKKLKSVWENKYNFTNHLLNSAIIHHTIPLASKLVIFLVDESDPLPFNKFNHALSIHHITWVRPLCKHRFFSMVTKVDGMIAYKLVIIIIVTFSSVHKIQILLTQIYYHKLKIKYYSQSS